MTIARVLIIAGSDSSGGAGIQADLKTVSALGVFGMTAITALTAQNTTGVDAVLEVEPEFIARQIDACVTDIGCDAVKIGMLSNARIIEIVAHKLYEYRLAPVVLDPVMIAKSGALLQQREAIDALKTKLFPMATVTTPNLYEAAMLVGREIETLQEMKDAARAIRELGPANVVVKAGHVPAIAADLLYDGHDFIELSGERIDATNTHGTGCIFASAIAAGLAQKKTVRESVSAARQFVLAAIRGGFAIGKGHGPANPMAGR
jgi:hydroxymethylpyrimidine/phosphomethylpyrimidine kinase